MNFLSQALRTMPEAEYYKKDDRLIAKPSTQRILHEAQPYHFDEENLLGLEPSFIQPDDLLGAPVNPAIFIGRKALKKLGINVGRNATKKAAARIAKDTPLIGQFSGRWDRQIRAEPYTELASESVEFLDDVPGLRRARGKNFGYSSETNEVLFPDVDLLKERGQRGLMHEYQHAMQKQEEFSRGGSPRDMFDMAEEILKERQMAMHELRLRMKDHIDWRGMKGYHDDEYKAMRKELESMSKDSEYDIAYKLYQKLAGEWEARNAAKRVGKGIGDLAVENDVLFMTGKPFGTKNYQTADDIPLEELIYRDKDADVMSPVKSIADFLRNK